MNEPSHPHETCSQCGKPLAKSCGQAICPACLMRQAVHPSPSEMVAPTIDLTQSMSLIRGSVENSELPDLAPNQSFGDYTIIRRLGRGGMGVVYEADHVPTARRVALKIMSHSLDSLEARSRFLREGRLAASINHPNCVYVYGTEEIDGRPAISMELVRGGTLGQQIKTRGTLSPKDAVDAVLQIVEGMEAAYNAGVLHRDIKPNNCFVDEKGHLKVGDFGLSITATGREMPAGAELARTQTEITQVGTFLGTPAYASPEQLRGEPLDHRSDIYSIGVTLYYLLSGQVPFAADNMIGLLARVLDNQAPTLKEIGVDAPEGLERVVAQCLKKAPGDRISSYAELRAALLPLSSRVLAPAKIGSRFLAGAIDYLFLSIVISPVSIWLMSSNASVVASDPFPGISAASGTLLSIILQVTYYGGAEWRFGRTLGKHVMGMCVVQDSSKPTLFAAIMRALLWFVPPLLPTLILAWAGESGVRTFSSFGVFLGYAIIGWSSYLIHAAMFLTASKQNGYAAVHDLVTGTRLVETPTAKAFVSTSTTSASLDSHAGTEMIGPYYVLETLAPRSHADVEPETNSSGKWMLGYDAKLLRRVWLHVRKSDARPLPSTWRTTTESSRLRWLGGHCDRELAWDAFEALPGCALADQGDSEGVGDKDSSLDWPKAKGVLRQLIGQLQSDSQSTSLPENFSVGHLWVTPEGGLKLLPFSFVVDPVADSANEKTAVEETRIRAPTGPVAVIRAVAEIFAVRHGLTKQSDRRMSLTESQIVRDLKTTDSVSSAAELIAKLPRDDSISVSYRAAGMVAATLVLPLFTIVSSLLMTLMFNRQEASMPRVRELSDIVVMLEQEPNVSNPEVVARCKALRIYARANYRDIWEDPAMQKSIYGQTLLMSHATRLNNIFSAPEPTPEEVAAAADEFAAIREYHGDLPRMKAGLTGTYSSIVWAGLTWLQLVWIPSIFTGLLFRGGLLLRLFGLTLVNSRGKRASGIRVSVRMLATGLIPVCCFVSIAILQSWNSGELQVELMMQYVAASFIAIGCLAVMIYRSRSRFFSDRCAGTFLVAR